MVNGTGPIKRRRRTRSSISGLKTELYNIVWEIEPATVRQVFYQAVSRGLTEKTEQEYKGTICRLLADMRREGMLPFHWIADNTRWMRKPASHSSLDSMLRNSQQLYRRDLWESQDAYVEIWLEKDALSGVLYGVTKEWDVPLMVTRGYPSLSFLNSAAEAIGDQHKPVHLYYFGDHDPSGKDIPRVVEKTLRQMAPDADISFQLVAVTPEQIDDLCLPTRPTKKTDSRSKGFKGESVEVDAIPPDTLRNICRTCITQHVVTDQLQATLEIERLERETLGKVAATLRGEGRSDG